MRKAKADKHVLLMFSRNNKADRDRLSGSLRFASEREDWEVRILDCSSPDTLKEYRELARDWRINAAIYSERGRLPKVLRGQIEESSCLAAEIDAWPAGDRADVSVRLDAAAVTEAAYRILSRRGFSNLAYFGTSAWDERDYSAQWERLFGSLAAGAASFSVFRMREASGWAGSLKRASEWVKNLPKPCGIMSYSDELSRDLLDACRLSHTLVPEQVSIIGVDNAVDICETARPSLSSILPDFERSGYMAAETLELLFRSRARCRRQIVLTYGIKDVLERTSTMDLSGCGRIATAASEIIRRDFRDPITVTDVAKRLNVSTRLLEMHFKKIFGTGVKREILRLRLDAVRDELLTGHRPIGEASSLCGFLNANTAQIAFRRRFGMSMLDFRAGNKSSPFFDIITSRKDVVCTRER